MLGRQYMNTFTVYQVDFEMSQQVLDDFVDVLNKRKILHGCSRLQKLYKQMSIRKSWYTQKHILYY